MYKSKIVLEDMEFIRNSIGSINKLKKQSILITGAYGMLATYITLFLLYLNERYNFNIQIIILVRDRKKAEKRFSNFNLTDLIIIENDLCENIEIELEIDYIFHAASFGNPQYFTDDPIGVVEPNVYGTINLLKFAQSKKIKSFLFFSSGAVYGSEPLCEHVTENDYGYIDPLVISNCYAESKRMGENLCSIWLSKYNIPIKIVRPAHIYGPTMDIDNDSRVVASFIRNIMSRDNININTNGESYRSFCYIADATVAFFILLLDSKNGTAYNVGNDSMYMSIKDLANEVVKLLPKRDLKVILNNKVKCSNRMLLVSKRLENLKWKCHYNIESGLSRTVQYYIEKEKL